MLWIGLRFMARKLREGAAQLLQDLEMALRQEARDIYSMIMLFGFTFGFVFASMATTAAMGPIGLPTVGSYCVAVMEAWAVVVLTLPAKFIEHRNWVADTVGAVGGAGAFMYWAITHLYFTTTQDYVVLVTIFGLLGAIFGMNTIMRPLAGAYRRSGGPGRVARAIRHAVW
jgi:hypothetical protein